MALYLPQSIDFLLERMPFSTWVDHIPFGYDLVGALRPKVVVELGTQSGVSYFTFCQAVLDRGLETRCFAVDTWRGDEHTQSYDDSIYEQVFAHNQAHYAQFSTLLRMLFEEAAPRFDDASIDLLHIDGYHTYEAVRGDFELWYPKLEPGGIVLFHDVMARLLDFGAWRFWEELARQHETFLFKHGFGLGVLRKPGGPPRDASLLKYLFSDDPAVQDRLRRFYVHISEHQDYRRKQRRVARLKP
jgi:methyltransferase family protein